MDKIKLAVVRVRGSRNLDPRIKVVLQHLQLHKANHCVIVDNTVSYTGSLQMVKDYVTYGPITESTLLKLLNKRGEKGSKKLRELKKEDEIKKIAHEIFTAKPVKEFVDPVFRLHAPRGGHKDIKVPYPRGALGKRETLDTLLTKMM